MILDMDNIRLKSLENMPDSPCREDWETGIGVEATQIQCIHSLDANAIPFGLIGMSAFRTNQGK